MSSEAAAAPSTSQDAGASTSGLPAAAKAAAEAAVKTAISETVPEEGEINESEENGVNGDAKKDGAAAGGIRTVFSDPANFNVVHPLYSKWYAATSTTQCQRSRKDNRADA